MIQSILVSLSALIISFPAMGFTEDPFKEHIGLYTVEDSKCFLNFKDVRCSDFEVPFNRVSIELSSAMGHRVVSVTYYRQEAVIRSESYETFSERGNDWSTQAVLSDTKPEWAKRNTVYIRNSNGHLVNLLNNTWSFTLKRLADGTVDFRRGNQSSMRNIGGDGTIYPGEVAGSSYILRRVE